ncbi:hypothetical protein HZA86_00065 [Candidatus Uhrbacteria bacterium]|nr:hypothetical protein [Candidatus Uhrbacteria bacterium]
MQKIEPLSLDLLIECLLGADGVPYQETLEHLETRMLDEHLESRSLVEDLLQRYQRHGVEEAEKSRISYILTLIFLHRHTESPLTAEALSVALLKAINLPGVLLVVAQTDHRPRVQAQALRYLAEHHIYLIYALRRSPPFISYLKELNEGRVPAVVKVAAALALENLRTFYPEDPDVAELFHDARTTSGSWQIRDLLDQSEAARKARDKKDGS